MVSSTMGSMGMTGSMPAGMTPMMPGAAAGMNCMMVPRCTVKMEKCTGGMKITCSTSDKMACGACRTFA